MKLYPCFFVECINARADQTSVSATIEIVIVLSAFVVVLCGDGVSAFDEVQEVRGAVGGVGDFDETEKGGDVVTGVDTE